jgi:hypothetical protein
MKPLPLLILGDIHHRWAKAETILQRLKGCYRKAILLGDYFDDFFDDEATSAKTARWLAQSLQQTDRIHLLGNHDLPYLSPMNPHLLCPGFTWPKCNAIAKELAGAPLDRLKLAHAEDGWLFSHAGFAHRYAVGEDPVILARQANEIMSTLHKDEFDAWVARGIERGGNAKVGGITWLDWRSEFRPVPGVNQIVGHTPGPAAKAQILRRGQTKPTVLVEALADSYLYRDGETPPYVSINWCLDCRLRQVALVQPRRIDIMDTFTLIGETKPSETGE